MKRSYRLHAEPGRYTITGNTAKGILGANYTGRSIEVGPEYSQAKQWIEDYETSQVEDPELEGKLLGVLRSTAAKAYDAPLFRGRLFETTPVSNKDFGPPPPDKAKRGRYNQDGVPVLYLCSSKMGILRELSIPPGRRLWIQQFHLLPQLRMCDARDLTPDSFAAAVFWLIESGRDRNSAPPRLGERIGELLSIEYDGLVVPGVRGEPNELYHNVDIFNPTTHGCNFSTQALHLKR